MLRKSFKYRIYPTKAQAATLDAHLRICCEIYNAALQERRDAWRVSKKSVTLYDQINQLPAVRKEQPEVGSLYSRVLYDPLRRVDLAFKHFFRRVRKGGTPGYPRFKPYRRYDSLLYDEDSFRVEAGRLTLGKIGAIRLKLHRPLTGEVKTVTVKREVGRWFAVVSMIVDAEPLAPSTEHIGIDVGLTHFATLSDGTQIDNPRHARVAERQMRRAQRRFSRRVKGSTRLSKAARLVARARARVRQQRADFHHKLSRSIVNRYGLIAVEDLNVQGLAGGMLAKSVNDAGWTSFLNKLPHKAESAGRELVKVDPRGTSQTCTCGASVRKRLSDREHACVACGLVADRDHVSAQVILQRSARTGPSGANVGALAPCVA
jgi:putative transposase